ncbi:MAG: class I SAM-dependent methyltransferase [Bacteroidia bacterium]|nr:class I SAM-dependent methyltransferase [Bacteroidia bacterium]
MNPEKETFETWNKMAALYQEKFMEQELYNDSYRAFCDAVKKPDARILDLACGPGNITRYLLQRRPGYRVEGIDIAPNMVTLAQENNPAARFSVMDCRDLYRLEAGYDGIICGFALPYLSEQECGKLISDAYRLLQPQGVLYLSFVEGDPAASGYKSSSSGDRVYFNFHDLKLVTRQLLQAGFETPALLKVPYPRPEAPGEMHTVLIAGKGSTAG